MGMQKLEYIRKLGLGEANAIIEKVNEIIDKMNAKIEIEEVEIFREVKDFKFFKGEEVKLPFNMRYTLTTTDDASKVFDQYVFTYKEMKEINDLIIKGKYVSLSINVVEDISEKDIKQEIVFEEVKAIDLDKPIKAKGKRGRKKKVSWN